MKGNQGNPSLTIRTLLGEATKALRGAGMSTPGLDAEVLMCHLLHIDRTQLLIRARHELTEEQSQDFHGLVRRRCDHEPVAYITGGKEFWSLSLHVNRHVLIPRPETEILVEETLRAIPPGGDPPGRVLEIGVGSGAISIALASSRTDIEVTATDISVDAVTVARLNAERTGVAARIAFVVCSLFDGLSGVFDVIVSNPPYIADAEYEELPADVRLFEPPGALRGGSSGLDVHREIIEGARRHLEPGGRLVMEIGAGQRQRLDAALLRSGAYDGISCRQDYAGRDRVITARRI